MRQVERRARTSERLLDAAAEVFAERGFHAATLDDIAAVAGYSKGAVYSNFAGKDALFLALLDRHLDAQVAAVEQLAGATSDADLAAVLTTGSAGEAFGVLMLEFWLYAARNEAARAALAARYARVRTRLADLIGTRKAGSRSPADAATLALAIDAGLFLQQLVDPAAVPADLRTTAIAEVIKRR
jgi:AcrR family transcriptional regulator